jgi:hypothetical protein
MCGPDIARVQHAFPLQPAAATHSDLTLARIPTGPGW